MAGFDFDTVWREHRTFSVDGVDVPVARLMHIVQSKDAANRDKDRLFLSTHEETGRSAIGRSTIGDGDVRPIIARYAA